jgi:hypothetical protein
LELDFSDRPDGSGLQESSANKTQVCQVSRVSGKTKDLRDQILSSSRDFEIKYAYTAVLSVPLANISTTFRCLLSVRFREGNNSSALVQHNSVFVASRYVKN